ncbi:hypothetical protein MTO96_052392 [Rhipicephalus appendiculatus]
MLWQIFCEIVVVTSTMLNVAKCSSCEDNEKATYCTKSQVVRQDMCPKTKYWQCTTGSWSCACQHKLYRSQDGACVPFERCDPRYRTPKPRTTKFPKGTYIPGSTAKVLQSAERLVEVLATKERIFDPKCFCMDSDYYTDFPPRNVVRTVSCRKFVSFGNFADALVKFKQKILFELIMDNGITALLLRRYRKENTTLPFGLPSKVHVLYADGHCIVLKLPKKKGPPMCSLWGPDNASGRDESVCFNTFYRECPGGWIDSYLTNRDRCEQHDKLAEGHGKKRRNK